MALFLFFLMIFILCPVVVLSCTVCGKKGDDLNKGDKGRDSSGGEDQTGGGRQELRNTN